MTVKTEARGDILVVEDGSLTHHVLVSAITYMTKHKEGGCIYIQNHPLPVITNDYEAALAVWIKYLRFEDLE